MDHSSHLTELLPPRNNGLSHTETPVESTAICAPSKTPDTHHKAGTKKPQMVAKPHAVRETLC